MSVEDELRYCCILCGIDTTVGNDFDQMSGAVAWRTHGNYGSRIVDNVDSEPALEIHICDCCLLLHRERVYEVTNGHKQTVAKWNAPKVDGFSEEIVRIFKGDDGQVYSRTHHERGSIVGTGAPDLLTLLQRLLETENRMTVHGHPFGVPQTGDYSVDAYISLARARICHEIFGTPPGGYPYVEEQERIWNELSEEQRLQAEQWIKNIREAMEKVSERVKLPRDAKGEPELDELFEDPPYDPQGPEFG